MTQEAISPGDTNLLLEGLPVGVDQNNCLNRLNDVGVGIGF